MQRCCRDPETRAEKGKSDVPKRLSLFKAQSKYTSDSTSPYYANEKFEVYYPKKKSGLGVELADEIAALNCPMSGGALEYIMQLDLTPELDKVDVNKNDVFRTIKRLDEKLNSPVCRFLEDYQPDVDCACEETALFDAQCPCPSEKERLHFDLADGRKRGGVSINEGLQNDWYSYDTTNQSPIRSRRQSAALRTSERDKIENQIKVLDEKLGSPELHFLKPLEPEQMTRCACQETNFPQAHCACRPTRDPIDFRNTGDVRNKIKAMDTVWNSPDIGFTCGGKFKQMLPAQGSSTKKSILKRFRGGRSPRSCQLNCPPPRCRCGGDCPAKPGPFQKFPERTFHVPECPSDRGWMVHPRSPVSGIMTCPFSPACCPIAEVCPFPVATVYDPNAPPLPPADGPRKCPLVPTTLTSSEFGDPSRPPCPLDPLKPPRGPARCPLKSPSACPMGQQSECPLLTCSLGPLKSIIFDGNEECPFCNAKCCPKISPDGPGCPISINSTFCPLGNTNYCCLKGMSSPPRLPGCGSARPTPGTENDKESCPIGKLLEANAKMPGCKCHSQQFSCPLTPPTPCPAASPQSSCYCGSSATPGGTPVEKTTQPDGCPLVNLRIPQPPAPPCPITFTPDQKKLCPMTNLGDKNLDPSCPIANMFECPALKKKPFLLPTSTTNEPISKTRTTDSKLELKNAEQTREQQPPQEIKSIMHRSSPEKKKQPRKSSPKVQKSGSIIKMKTSKEAVTSRRRSESIRKTDKEMMKTFSRISKSNRSVSDGSEIFEVSLESLPHPPRSETRLLSAAPASSRARQPSSWREDAPPLVKTSAPSDSKGFERPNGKTKPRNCPIPDPEPCPLEVPRCPFGPPEPSCPMAKVPNCPLRVSKDGCMTGMLVSSTKPDCPTETTPCNLFPEGHCPMDNLNMCECNFPIAPCLEPLIPIEDAQAEEQYCSRLDCCMGLPLPPTKPSETFETDTWYAFMDEKSGNPATKHYLEILDVPPEPEFFVSINALRKHPAWKIIKYGEGYKECKRIKEILASRGPTATLGTQFVEDELPDDEEIEIIRKTQQEVAETMERIRLSNLPTTDFQF